MKEKHWTVSPLSRERDSHLTTPAGSPEAAERDGRQRIREGSGWKGAEGWRVCVSLASRPLRSSHPISSCPDPASLCRTERWLGITAWQLLSHLIIFLTCDDEFHHHLKNPSSVGFPCRPAQKPHMESFHEKNHFNVLHVYVLCAGLMNEKDNNQ